MRMSAAFRAPRRSPFLQVAKSAIATIGAWLLAGWLIPGQPPVFAAIAALLVVQPSVNQSLTKALERSVGVVVGVVVASGLGLLLGSAAWVVVVAVAVAVVVAWALRMTAGTTNQVGISALLVLALGTATPGYAVDRVIETVIGAVIGIVVNLLLVPPLLVEPARERLVALGGEVAASLDRLAAALTTAQTPESLEELLLSARLMRPMREAAEKAIAEADESLTLNPRSRRHRDELERMSALLTRLTSIVTQVIGMTRTCRERYDPALPDEPTVRAIAEQLRRAAHDVRLVAGRGTAPADTPGQGDDDPALTRPLQVHAPPSPEHWILVGSLLADLGRIHETLRGEN